MVREEDYMADPMTFADDALHQWLESMLSRMGEAQNTLNHGKQAKLSLAEIIDGLAQRGFERVLLKTCSENLAKPCGIRQYTQAKDFLKSERSLLSIWFAMQFGPKEYLSHDISLRYVIKTGNWARYIHARDAVTVMRQGEYSQGATYINSGKIISVPLLFITCVESLDKNNFGAMEHLVYTRMNSFKKTVLLCNTATVDKLVVEIGDRLTSWAGDSIFEIERE